MSKKLTTNEFIINATKAHGNKYDYSKAQYVDAYTKIIIICPIHGEFLKKPHDHVTSKTGCVKCTNKEQLTTANFINKAKIIHHSFYEYSLVCVVNNSTKVNIICPIHGIFKQTPKSHLRGIGCITCSGKEKYSNKSYIDAARKVHGEKYDYSSVVYINSSTKISILCKRHGKFNQLPSCHLSGKGCPSCSHKVSNPEIQWLNINNVKYRQHPIKIGNRNILVDGYNPNTNTIYEFYGDYWHGNPNLYNKNDINPTSKKCYGELYNKTIQKEKLLKQNGFNVISIWESNFMKYVTIVGVGALGSHVVQLIRNIEHSIRIIDFDRVEVKNTYSQFHSKKSIGKLKAVGLKQLMDFLFATKLDIISNKLTEENVDKLLKNSALVIDCLDNGISRTIVQNYVRKNNIPCLHGAIANDGTYGQIIWDENFTIDFENIQGAETACDQGIHLPFIAIVSAYLAKSVHEYLGSGKKNGYQINPAGSIKI